MSVFRVNGVRRMASRTGYVTGLARIEAASDREGTVRGRIGLSLLLRGG